MTHPDDDPYFIAPEEEAALEAKAEHDAIEAWLEAWERDMDDPRYIETLEAQP